MEVASEAPERAPSEPRVWLVWVRLARMSSLCVCVSSSRARAPAAPARLTSARPQSLLAAPLLRQHVPLCLGKLLEGLTKLSKALSLCLSVYYQGYSSGAAQRKMRGAKYKGAEPPCPLRLHPSPHLFSPCFAVSDAK